MRVSPRSMVMGQMFEIFDGLRCRVCVLTTLVVDDHLMIIVAFYTENVVFAQQAYAMIGRFRMRRITDVAQVIDGFTAVFLKKYQGVDDGLRPAVAVGHDADVCIYRRCHNIVPKPLRGMRVLLRFKPERSIEKVFMYHKPLFTASLNLIEPKLRRHFPFVKMSGA